MRTRGGDGVYTPRGETREGPPPDEAEVLCRQSGPPVFSEVQRCFKHPRPHHSIAPTPPTVPQEDEPAASLCLPPSRAEGFKSSRHLSVQGFHGVGNKRLWRSDSTSEGQGVRASPALKAGAEASNCFRLL